VSGELRARALSAIEKMQGTSDKHPFGRHADPRAVGLLGLEDRQALPDHLSPAYLRAWSKMACNRQHTMTDVEQRAMNEAERSAPCR
jgi:hypothetical protein